jgi:uncharacterized protein YndB with AHSA1/START domain
MAAYSFVTHWRFAAPLEQVWQELDAADRYTEWWPAIRAYRDLTPEIHGLGARAERVVRGVLPYELRYTTTVTRYVPPREIAYDAAGDLNGNGRFVLRDEAGETHVTFDWNVSTAGFWLNLLAPFLKPLFAWNHNWVMTQGERGLAARLRGMQPPREAPGGVTPPTRVPRSPPLTTAAPPLPP